jgi:hypothetical protein
MGMIPGLGSLEYPQETHGSSFIHDCFRGNDLEMVTVPYLCSYTGGNLDNFAKRILEKPSSVQNGMMRYQNQF